MRTYDKPELPVGVKPIAIRPQQQPNILGPDTEVTVIFRGGPPIVDMYDSRDYVVPEKPDGLDLVDYRAQWCDPAYFTMPYAIALHLQERSIVPGTRNPTNFRIASSQLGILNVDPPDRCQPFTPDQLKRFGGTYKEGIDRSLMEGETGKVAIVDVAPIANNLQVDRVIADAEESQRGFNRDVEGGEGVAMVQSAEAGAAAARVQHSPTKAGKVKFKDAPRDAE